jgi:hypothetical protein
MFVKTYVLISHIPVLVSLIYGAILFKKLDQTLKIFCYFLFVSDLVQMLSLFCWFKGVNNLPILHVYVPIGFICLTYFYVTVLKGFINGNILWLGALFFLLLSVINSIWIQKPFTYNSYALSLESILIIIYSTSTFIFLLNHIFKESKTGLITSLNWINSGLFIYYLSSLIIFYFGNLLAVHSTSIFIKYTWAFHAFFSIIMYTCFIIALWKRPNK